MPGNILRVESLSVGFLETNCYIVYDSQTKQAIVIDPGDGAREILLVINKYQLKVVSLMHTHGHFDHLGATRRLKKETNAPVLLHQRDMFMVKDIQPDQFIHEPERLAVGAHELTIMDTPGHTPGGVSLVGADFVFTGDTLFHHAVGRTDLPGGNEEQLWQSIYKKIFALPDSFTVYPGHGMFSTIGEEKRIWKR